MKKFHLKSFIAGIIFCAMVFTFLNVYAESATKTIEVMYDNMKIKVAGKEVSAEPFTYEGIIYLPVTALTGIADYKVESDEDGSSLLSLSKKTSDVKLTDVRSIEDYLIENYSIVKTSYGKCRLTFSVGERRGDAVVFDYAINVEIEKAFYFDYLSPITKLLPGEFNKVRSEMKANMETLANDLIKKLPEKKLQGDYNQSYYKNLTKTKKEYVSVLLCCWANYKYNNRLKDKYADVKPTDTLVWDTVRDTR